MTIFKCIFKSIKANASLGFVFSHAYKCSHSFCTYRTSELSNKIICEIVAVEDDEKTVKVFDEILYLQTKDRRLPDCISDEQIKELYALETKTQRFEYLKYLFKKEKIKIRDLEKKASKQLEIELQPKKEKKLQNEHGTAYGMGYNSLLLHIRNKTVTSNYNHKLANATLFGSKVVLDLGYEKLMTEKERKACVSQLKLVYSTNRQNLDPFDLYFCNADPLSKSVQNLEKYLPGFEDSLITITHKNYLDIFPQDKLVYLSPHAEEKLSVYNHDAVYIIGAFVDVVKRKPVSLEKSKLDGIKTCSLPLDDYVLWGAGTKSLTINQAFEILLQFKNTGDWKKAFSVIPSRKIRKIDKEQADEFSLSNKIFLTNS